MAHIGIKIKELRKKKDMTQEKLAEYLNVSFQAVSKWETGAASPDLSMIVPLARLLDVTTDELFGVDSNEELLRQEKLKEIYYETWKIILEQKKIYKKVFFLRSKQYSYFEIKDAVIGHSYTESNSITISFSNGKSMRFRLTDENAGIAVSRISSCRTVRTEE